MCVSATELCPAGGRAPTATSEVVSQTAQCLGDPGMPGKGNNQSRSAIRAEGMSGASLVSVSTAEIGQRSSQGPLTRSYKILWSSSTTADCCWVSGKALHPVLLLLLPRAGGMGKLFTHQTWPEKQFWLLCH